MDQATRLKEFQTIGDQKAADHSQPIYDPLEHLGRSPAVERRPPDRTSNVDAPERVTVVHPELPDGQVLSYGRPAIVDPAGRIETPPLFYGRPVRDQVRQGSLNDGWLIAALGAVAGHRVHALREIVRERADGCYEVRFHDAAWDSKTGEWTPTGRRVELEVTPEVPVDPTDPWTAAFANTDKSSASWVTILEKAFAGLDQTDTPGHPRRAKSGYDRLDQGGSASDTAQALALLTGQRAGVICLPNDPAYATEFESAIREQLGANQPVVVSTTSTEVHLPHGLSGSQSYEVIDNARGLLTLRNPTGVHPDQLTARQLISLTDGQLATLRSS